MDKDFMIFVFNNFPEDYNVILDGFENSLMATGNNTLGNEVICKELNHQNKKKKNKKDKKV